MAAPGPTQWGKKHVSFSTALARPSGLSSLDQLGHMPSPEPITLVGEVGGVDWSNLGHRGLPTANHSHWARLELQLVMNESNARSELTAGVPATPSHTPTASEKQFHAVELGCCWQKIGEWTLLQR